MKKVLKILAGLYIVATIVAFVRRKLDEPEGPPQEDLEENDGLFDIDLDDLEEE